MNGWLVKPYIGAHAFILEQDYSLNLANPTSPSRYSRSEQIKSEYYGPRFGLDVSGELTPHLSFDFRSAVSFMAMTSDYQGNDHNFATGKRVSITRSLDNLSMNSKVSLGLSYKISRHVQDRC